MITKKRKKNWGPARAFGSLSLIVTPLVTTSLVSCGSSESYNKDYNQTINTSLLTKYILGTSFNVKNINQIITNQTEYKNYKKEADKKAYRLLETLNAGQALWNQIWNNKEKCNQVETLIIKSQNNTMRVHTYNLQTLLYEAGIPTFSSTDPNDNWNLGDLFAFYNTPSTTEVEAFSTKIQSIIKEDINKIESISQETTISDTLVSQLLAIANVDNDHINQSLRTMISYIFSRVVFMNQVDISGESMDSIDAFMPIHHTDPGQYSSGINAKSTLYNLDKGLVSESGKFIVSTGENSKIYSEIKVADDFTNYLHFILPLQSGATYYDYVKWQFMATVEVVNIIRTAIGETTSVNIPADYRLNYIEVSLPTGIFNVENNKITMQFDDSKSADGSSGFIGIINSISSQLAPTWVNLRYDDVGFTNYKHGGHFRSTLKYWYYMVQEYDEYKTKITNDAWKEKINEKFSIVLRSNIWMSLVFSNQFDTAIKAFKKYVEFSDQYEKSDIGLPNRFTGLGTIILSTIINQTLKFS